MHLFAGIGGGIYGGALLGNKCVAAVEINKFCQKVLKQRQLDGWMEKFEIYGDLTQLGGHMFRGTFDILCGGFPCQAFSHAAHGKNIKEKNLWPEMLRFVEESDAPIVFAENVVAKALTKAQNDLEDRGYRVQMCRLSNAELGADHQRDRYWLLAVKDGITFLKLVKHIINQPKLKADCWLQNPLEIEYPNTGIEQHNQLTAIGNAQSPYVAACAFRILVNRHITSHSANRITVSISELLDVFDIQQTWTKQTYGQDFTFHTPTTTANYCSPSMQKHASCRNYVQIFGGLNPRDAEYLMGFPIGASYPLRMVPDITDSQEDRH